MAAYAYTRKIVLGGKDFTKLVNNCSFSWSRNIGCDNASLAIQAANFDDMLSLKAGDTVSIEFSDSVPWWTGIIIDLSTNLTNGLSIECAGIARTIFSETLVHDAFGLHVMPSYVTTLAATVTETPGNLGMGFHKYYVTTFDGTGERASSDGITAYPEALAVPVPDYDLIKVEAEVTFAGTSTRTVHLTWDDDDRATKWRIYKQITTAQSSAFKGQGAATALLAYTPTHAGTTLHYMDVTTPEFTDDGSIDWNTLPSASLPQYDTCRMNAIAAETSPYAGGQGIFSARSAVRYLVNTYYASGYDETLLTSGMDTPLFDLDFSTEDTTLADALQTICDFVGGVMWGVRQDNKVFFTDRVDSSEAGTILKEFIITTPVTPTDVLPVDTDVTDPLLDVLVNCTRQLTRDGATTLHTASSMASQAKAAAHVIRAARGRLTADVLGTTSTENTTNRSTECRIYLPVGATEIPAITSAAEFFAAYPTAADFEVAFPGMNWLYRMKDFGGGDWAAWLLQLLLRMRNEFHGTTAPGVGGVRRKGALLSPYGMRHPYEVLRLAANVATEHTPVVGKWTVNLTQGGTLFTPGSGLIAVTSQQNVRYVMAIQSVAYTFDDSVEVELTCGEPDIKNLADAQRNKVLTKLVDDSPFRLPFAGAGGPLSIEGRETMPSLSGISIGSPGISNTPAPIDHSHPIDPDPFNALHTKDGSIYPNVQRDFQVEGSDTSALDNLVDPGHADYVRGLSYRNGDLATVHNTSGGGSIKRYFYALGTWEELGGGVGTGGAFAIPTVLVLPAIPLSGAAVVYWTSLGGGTGDNQIWWAYAGQSAWTPGQFFTTKSGTP